MTASQGPTETRGAAGVPASAKPVLSALELVAGEIIRATVLRADGNGGLLIGLSGRRLEAFSEIPLEVGRSYEFRVAAATSPIVLTSLRTVPTPVGPGLADAGLLGLPPGVMDAAFKALAEVVARPPEALKAAPPEPDGRPAPDLSQVLARIARGAAEAADLQTLHQRLGHDQEARVLRFGRLAQSAQPAERALLVATAKALALEIIDAQAEPAANVRFARTLVEALGRIELDNAHRSEQASPLWLPLPAFASAGLRDARMFLMRPPIECAEST